MMNKKGQNAALVWIMAIVSIFIVGITWISMAEPFEQVDSKIGSQINDSFQPTRQKIVSVFKTWPLWVILGIILWALAQMLRREPQAGFV